MPLRLLPRPTPSRSRKLGGKTRLWWQQYAYFPLFARAKSASWPATTMMRHGQSTASTTVPATAPQSKTTREDLEAALLEVRRRAGKFCNISQLHLALRNLREPAGRESIRVAVLGNRSGSLAKELVRLLLADPLRKEAAWEHRLYGHDGPKPLIIRVGLEDSRDDQEARLVFSRRENGIDCIYAHAPALNACRLEILAMEQGPSEEDADVAAEYGRGQDLLVPTVQVRHPDAKACPVLEAPVHKTLVVGKGLQGAVDVGSMRIVDGGRPELVRLVVQMDSCPAERARADHVQLSTVDLGKARAGLDLIRQNVGNAMKYEALWTEANMAATSAWLKWGAEPNDDPQRRTKAAVLYLVEHILTHAQRSLSRDRCAALDRHAAGAAVKSDLDRALASWVEEAHKELQEQLNLAVTARHWRELGWWKLFWRADDVGMLLAEMLAVRFLPRAEQELIYLAGWTRQVGLLPHKDNGAYAGSSAPVRSVTAEGRRAGPARNRQDKWPLHIAIARRAMLEESIPALQALAQKLVAEAVGTAALTSALGLLACLSSFGAYESGAVAALGVVWSLERLQRKWERARAYWESELREEGRKAVGATEESAAALLARAAELVGQATGGEEAKRAEAEAAVEHALDVLARVQP